MERLLKMGVSGGIKLPVGYRFCPTDEELVCYYLKKKAFNQPMPISLIPEFDVFQTEPWGLPSGPGIFKEKKFFFSCGKGQGHGNMSKIAAGSYGFWKPVGKEKEIVYPGSNKLIGVKKTLVFCEGKRSFDTKTLWVMHEFRLAGYGAVSVNPSQVPEADWAVYRIFKEKRRVMKKGPNGNGGMKVKDAEPSFIDFTVENGNDVYPPPPASPATSEGSEIC